jgi:hypothetical protein
MAGNLAIHGLAQAIDEPAGLIVLGGRSLASEHDTFDFGQQRYRRHMIVMQDAGRRIFERQCNLP